MKDIKKLKVAIVHEFLLKLGGAEAVLKSLCELFPDAPIYTFLYNEEKTHGIFKRKKITTSSLQNTPFLNQNPKLFLSKYSRAVEEFDLSSYDLVISSSNSFAHGVITKPSTLHLCYCHSPMRYAWDWYHEYLKENNLQSMLNPKGFFVRKVLHNIRIWDKVSSDRVDYWIANSKNVQQRIQKYYRRESKIIYPPVDLERFIQEENDIEQKDQYIIVSRLEPYKKIEIAIRAFNKNKKQLIIIGSGSYRSRLENIAHKNVSFLGWRSDENVAIQISKSKALIFPGEEDFGITPVEAMACGKPVIAYKKGGALETISEHETGIFFQHANPESLNDAIKQFEKAKFDRTKCILQSQQFSVSNFNDRFLEYLDKIIKDFYEK